MTKQEFIEALRTRLSGLPQKEAEERIGFYIEMIDDRIEEGLTEAEAVFAVGSVDDIAAQILSEPEMAKATSEKPKEKKKLSPTIIVLLILGAPVWLSLAVAAFSVIISLYAVLWSVIISLWSAFGSLAYMAIASIPWGICYIAGVGAMSGIAMIGAGLFCAGLSIFFFFGCRAITNGTVSLTKKAVLFIVNLFRKKEAAI